MLLKCLEIIVLTARAGAGHRVVYNTDCCTSPPPPPPPAVHVGLTTSEDIVRTTHSFQTFMQYRNKQNNCVLRLIGMTKQK